MSTQHTLGPWGAQHVFGTCYSVQRGQYHIGTIRGKQNARLIAASPDLMEAAKLVLAWYEAENDFTKEPDFYKRVEMCRVSEVALRAAIAKALGEKND